MARYDKNTKFYWLKLQEDFFENEALEWLEEQENGEKYSLFYLKLCLKSLKTNGILIRHVGEMLVPYDENSLAKLTKTEPDIVACAMELLTEIGLIKILDNGEIYLTQIENQIGKKSIGAYKKEQQRLKTKERQKVDNEETRGGQMSTYENKEQNKGQYLDKSPLIRKPSYINYYGKGGQMSA